MKNDMRLFITIYLKTIDSQIGADTMNNRLIVSIYEKKTSPKLIEFLQYICGFLNIKV